MSTRIAYLSVILIWSTTPLAIHWSSEGVGMLFSVTSRMLLGLIVVYVLLYGLKQRLRLDVYAMKTYLACGIGIYAAMMCVYYAAQYIPTGWISVVFGLAPIITGILARLILDEDALVPHKMIGMILGLMGLIIIFGNGIQSGQHMISGLGAVFAGTIVHSLSAVIIKKIGTQLSGLASTAGGLTVAVPLFFLTWVLLDGNLPGNISTRAVYAILYLGVIGSAAGFVLYYYILTHMEVSRVSLITLITPVCALALGNTLNGESITLFVFMGTGLIVSGLVFYQFGERLIGQLFTPDAIDKIPE